MEAGENIGVDRLPVALIMCMLTKHNVHIHAIFNTLCPGLLI